MPPRPPLTTLLIHTWKEHGKPRPHPPEETCEPSARARISRSISIDAHLTPHHHRADDPPRPPLSKPSPFENAPALSAPPAPPHPPPIPRSISADDALPHAFLPSSTPFLLTPVESEDEFDHLPPAPPLRRPSGPRHDPANLPCPPARRLPPDVRQSQPTSRSMSPVCVRGASVVAHATLPVPAVVNRPERVRGSVSIDTGLAAIARGGRGEGGA